MNNNINTLLNSLSDIHKIRKADNNIVEYSSESDNTMAVSSLYRPKYRYFPKSKTELRKIIAERIIDEGYNCNLNDIDISGAGDDLSFLFSHGHWENYEFLHGKFDENFHFDMRNFNGHIEYWDVSNVQDMEGIFKECRLFNQDISRWDVSNVLITYQMFYGCDSFKQNLSKWDLHRASFGHYSNYLIFDDNSIMPKEFMPKLD